MRTLRKDEGATALEFALVAPVLFILIFVVIYAGMYYFYAAVADHVARAVARDASIPSHGVYPTEVDEKAVADSTAGTLLPSPTSVGLSSTPRAAEGDELTVTVTYDIPGLTTVGQLLRFLPKSGTLTRTVTVRYE
jgi:Flp pilus assembly protein TadG